MTNIHLPHRSIPTYTYVVEVIASRPSLVTQNLQNPSVRGVPAERKCLMEAGFANYKFFCAPLRRFGFSKVLELISAEIPFLRDIFCEDVFCKIWKPITLSHFPD